jgi:hypothetical protein
MPFDLQKALASIAQNPDLDPVREQMAEATRIGRNRLKQNTVAQRIARAKAQEVSILDSLAMLEKEPDSELKTIRVNNGLARLSELYGEQGKWPEALAVTQDEKQRVVIEGILAAITTPEGSTCECPDDVVTDRVKQIHFREAAMQNVGTIIHDEREVTLKICRRCGFQNTEG